MIIKSRTLWEARSRFAFKLPLKSAGVWMRSHAFLGERCDASRSFDGRPRSWSLVLLTCSQHSCTRKWQRHDHCWLLCVCTISGQAHFFLVAWKISACGKRSPDQTQRIQLRKESFTYWICLCLPDDSFWCSGLAEAIHSYQQMQSW